MGAALMSSCRPARRGFGWRALLQRWQRHLRQRRQLLSLTERELRDIGLTRCEAVREATKPFWRD
jgi:uncharacterized protein YjiS (DUF1127 family)